MQTYIHTYDNIYIYIEGVRIVVLTNILFICGRGPLGNQSQRCIAAFRGYSSCETGVHFGLRSCVIEGYPVNTPHRHLACLGVS